MLLIDKQNNKKMEVSEKTNITSDVFTLRRESLSNVPQFSYFDKCSLVSRIPGLQTDWRNAALYIDTAKSCSSLFCT